MALGPSMCFIRVKQRLNDVAVVWFIAQPVAYRFIKKNQENLILCYFNAIPVVIGGNSFHMFEHSLQDDESKKMLSLFISVGLTLKLLSIPKYVW